MGVSGSAPDVTREDVREIFTELAHPSTPVTVAEVVEQLDCTRDAARDVLTELADRGELRSKRIDRTTRVWWRADGSTPRQQRDREQKREREGERERDRDGDNEEEFRAFVSSVKDYAIFTLDPDGTIASWNEGAARIEGYEEAEIVGEHFSTFYTDEDVEADVPERNLEAARVEGRVDDEGWRVRADGTTFWAHVTITAVRDDDGTLQGFTKVTRDMTERREYEQRLRRERDLTEQILETASVGIGVIDADGGFTRANRRLLDHHGIDESELDAYDITSLDIYDSDGDPIPVEERPWYRAVADGETVHDFQCRVDLPNRGRRWLSLTAAPLEDDASDEPRAVVSVDDITEQKQREQRLGREYTQTEKLLRTAPVAIAVQNADRETVMANRRAQEAFGLSEQEFTDDPVENGEWEIYDSDGNPLEPNETPSARVLETGDPVFDEEFIFEPPKGGWLYFRINAAPVFGPDGEIERIVLAGKDITALKERERQLEQRKSELETELSEIFGRISDAFYALDDEWRFTHINDHAVESLDRSEAELLGRKIWDVIPDASAAFYREQFRTAMDTQEPLSFEVYEDDFDAWYEYNLYPSQSGLSVYFRDITERIERERELAKYETIVETINDGIYVKDEDGYFTMVNDAYAELTGYEPDELVGEHASLVVDEATIQQSKEVIAATDEEQPAMETELQTASGDRVPVEGTFATLQTDDDREEIGVVRDITERKQRERRLTRYKEFTDEILDAIDDIFYLLDGDGTLQRWNETLPAVTGYSDAELESTATLEFFDADGREKLEDAIADGFETGDSQVEVAIRTKDGERIPYEFVASTLEDPDGNEVLAGIGRDISDRREYERKLEASNERLEHFAYAASHDLQEPLRMVTSYLQLLENRYADELDSDAEEFIEYAVGGAERMRKMIDGLLEYSRVETQGDPFETVDLEAILEDATENLQVRIEESDAEITAESLPRVRGDASQLQQVFQNLFSNAIEYSGDEPPSIHVSAERTGSKYVISVRDEGIGIDPEDQEQIFDVFQRLHSRQEHSGTGIGLALCQRIVERHGGDIWVNSEPGAGATFSFTLPAADTAARNRES